MYWTIVSVDRIWKEYAELLPEAAFTLTNGTRKIKVSGWLPCHANNIQYEVKLRNEKRISAIVSVRKKGKKGYVSKPKRVDRKLYDALQAFSYRTPALWAAAIVYPLSKLCELCIRDLCLTLASRPRVVCTMGSQFALNKYMFDEDMAVVATNQILVTLGRTPIEDVATFKAQIQWQQRIRTDTGSFKPPPDGVENVQKYQSLWCSNEDIQAARTIADAFTPSTCTIVIGSPCESRVPRDAIVVVRNLEDAYRWKCHVSTGKLHMMRVPQVNTVQLGLGDITILESGRDVYVAWAHLWGVNDWCELIRFQPVSYTCIGRLDQYPAGRGQIFKNMCDHELFSRMQTRHYGTSHVVQIEDVTDIEAFVKDVVKKHGVVQCFADVPKDWQYIDTGRRTLGFPRRIRTIRPGVSTIEPPRIALYEEHHTKQAGFNASVKRVSTYDGLPVDAAIYLCKPETKAFDIHVARTHCRGTLYIVNCSTCLFSMQRRPPRRVTINPFI